MSPMPSAPLTRPIDATLSVTKAARLLGVHPNTVRAWSDAGRPRYYRINPRGVGGYGGSAPIVGRRGIAMAAAADRTLDGRAIPTDRERLRRRADLATIGAL